MASKPDDAATVVDSLPELPNLVDQKKQKQSLLGYFWDTADLSPEERRLLFKVDASVLIFASLGYFIKNLDQTNVTSAYFAGMREELGMYGNELVHATSYWTAGYVIGQVPSNLLLTRISPRYVIPVLELAWGLATLGTYAVKNVQSLFALRFLVGLFESGFYPGMHFILGSWYTPRELAKRSVMFWTAGSLGQMFSGFLQTAAYKNLNGIHGLSGWRWLMIVDAVITLPIAVLGFIFLPDLPFNAKKSFLLSPDDIALARARMKAIGRKESEPWTWAKLRRILTSWYIWILPIEYVLWNNGGAQSPMQYWLKSFHTKPAPVPGKKYTVSQIQLLPLPATAVFVVTAWFLAWQSDGPFKGKRYPFIYLGAVLNLIFNIAWLAMPLYENIPGHFAYFYLMTTASTAGPLILNWASEITQADNELRALCVALGNDLAYVVQAVAPNFVWKTTDFPRATKGYHWSIILQVLLILWTLLIQLLLRRDERKKNGQLEQTIEAGQASSSAHRAEIDDDPVKVSEDEPEESKHSR
ncbi:major facilitator superfamily domain-containing protein [Armillaria luteobubalina]|uniref:Major facilitator superfamily domain-containing protein n=1 Tax=Armillaria luteobubalina TaxID=153913 RepID=A0AA39UUL5_9AGAR|nr:major facilitator superfamily domain-containing protein [Armillaria luteobubalina]